MHATSGVVTGVLLASILGNISVTVAVAVGEPAPDLLAQHDGREG